MGQQVMTGTLASVIVVTGEKIMLRVVKNPLLVFGLGVVAGAVVYRNRKEIIAVTSKTVNTGKNIVLEQKEKVLDLIAEAKENG
ncbi:MAG: hypothetical protein ABSB19_13460 [Methylomonas sp.]